MRSGRRRQSRRRRQPRRRRPQAPPAAAADLGGVVEQAAPGRPWSEMEDWLLVDAVEKCTVENNIILWRRVVRETPELSDKSVEEARSRYLRVRGGPGGAGPNEGPQAAPPLLDQWANLGDGAFAGRVFGLSGVADGTAIITAPVEPANRRILDGYIVTNTGVLFELGPSSAEAAGGANGALEGGVSVLGRDVGGVRKDAFLSAQTLATAAGLGAAGIAAWAAIGHHLTFQIFIV